MELNEKIEFIPRSPGVYIMKRGKSIIYIGKAADLRLRVRSYFRKTTDTRIAARFLADRATDIDYIITTTEKEALILEETLLKKHKPRYNIRLKDDKTFVSIRLTVNEDFPRISITRRVRDDGARYFGPYASAKMVRETVKSLRKIFPLCVCSPHEFRNRVRPCLDYQLGICSAPAPSLGLISKEEYAELVRGAVMFLEGKSSSLISGLGKKMKEAAGAEKFEEAAKIRDNIEAIEATLEEQLVAAAAGTEQDVFSLYSEGSEVSVSLFFIRDGRLVGQRGFIFSDTVISDTEILSSLLRQYYSGGSYIPKEVLTSVRLGDAGVITEWLTEKRGKRCKVYAPRRGVKAKLLKMGARNAREALTKKAAEVEGQLSLELQRRLKLKQVPRVIEAYDISNLGGEYAVGAHVTFIEGLPCKDRYRRYRIKGVEGADDYAMMYEVLGRRFSHGSGKAKPRLPKPDLILMDGGKGQLAVAVKVMDELSVKGVSLASLAKDKPQKGLQGKGERVFLPGVKDPIHLKEGTATDLLLRRVRDEVHRFAITYHRKLRQEGMKSVLEQLPGVSSKRRIALFERFKDLDGIKSADTSEIAAVLGIGKRLAKEIKELLGDQLNCK